MASRDAGHDHHHYRLCSIVTDFSFHHYKIKIILVLGVHISRQGPWCKEWTAHLRVGVKFEFKLNII